MEPSKVSRPGLENRFDQNYDGNSNEAVCAKQSQVCSTDFLGAY
jgi:hypothetical protein